MRQTGKGILVMKNEVIKFIAKHERLRYILKCIRNFTDDSFVYDVNHIYEEPNHIFAECRGEYNKGKLIYPIILDKSDMGFFAQMRYVLNNLYYADIMGMSPYVKFGKKTLYAENMKINGSDNPFEAFFLQSLKNSEESFRVVKNRPERNGEINGWVNSVFNNKDYKVTDEYIDAMSDIWKKYLAFQPEVEKLICNTEFIEKIKEGKTLGVHVRGTDFSANIQGHPVRIDERYHITLAKKILKEKGFSQIYIATDEERTIDIFRKQFGEKVIYDDSIFRSKNGQAVHFTEIKRENHHYKLGLEVLKDAYALSSCDGFIAGLSQVSVGVRIIKKSRGESYSYLKIFDKGINKNVGITMEDIYRGKMRW